MGRYSGRSSRLIFMSLLSIALFAVEISVAYIGNSLSLASDAFAVLSHFISMIIGLLGVRFSRIRWHKANTFGFSRADVLGAFGNSVFATALMFSIFVEAIKRYINPQKTEKALLVLIVGIVGLFFNVFNYVLFMDCCFCHAPQGDPETGESPNDQKSPEEGSGRKVEKKSEALNIRGVLLHVMGDALGSVVVVVAATIFHVLPLEANAPCNWQCYIDPSLTIIMVFIILSSAFPLIKETSIILLQMVPKGVNMQLLTDRLARIPGVSSLHEVHVWELAGGKNIATLHVKCQTPTDYQDAAYKIRKVFHEAGIHSVTIQPEYIDHKTSNLLCSSPCISKACDSQLCCSQQEAPLAKTNGYTEKNDSCLSAQHKDNGSSKSDVEIRIDSPLTENGVKDMKNGEVSDDKSQLSSTRF
ncbi:zinc transporter 10 isoform X2 [Gallus gallus]|uniref:zinc transporter 10 isoform X2 n=1 Tax=Gallus gallus TaxID=9031 RepID=UPI0002C87D6B|nr:zinc transporter 10 isoform X2 [Gallus gallus]XP_040524655.1 zinc transporter 10 isoform X2 [Gallus gallus]|eukprot:XP_015139383.1 zinc transporter 10 isoform X2 [Gallus gallus]